jgi:DNA-binding transcriptional regulator WhiA
MADDPNKKKQDSKLVSQQDHEVVYLKRKHPYVTMEEVKDRIERYGPSREEVEKRLKSLDDRRRNG